MELKEREFLDFMKQVRACACASSSLQSSLFPLQATMMKDACEQVQKIETLQITCTYIHGSCFRIGSRGLAI